MRHPLIIPVAAAVWLATTTMAHAAARSHVEATAIAQAHLVHNTQFDGDVTPFWVGATTNRAGASVRATATQGGVLADVMGRASSQADFSGIRAETRGELGPLNDFLLPTGGSNGVGVGFLVMEWTITGAAGTTGSIAVSGSLFAASYVNNSLQSAWSGGSADALVALSRACGGPFCGTFSQLNANSGGPTPVVGYQQKDYTLTLPVQVGDRVTLNYQVNAKADGAATSWAGTTPVDVLPGAAISASAARAGAETSAGAFASPSFAQLIWLSGGLGLDSTDGLTLLADGHYGFGEVTAVPEPASWAMLLIGAAMLRRRVWGQAADDRCVP